MPLRIAGATLPNTKKIEYALPYIYGLGLTASRKVLAHLKIDPNKRTADLTESEGNQLREFIEKNYRIEGDLRREIMSNVKRLREIGAYRGMRHARGLPVRGQRTKTNSRTRRGNVRRTATSGKKPAGQKT